MSVLAVDVGTSGVRAAVVRPDSSVEDVHHRQCCRRRRRKVSWSSTPPRWPRPCSRCATAALDGGEAVSTRSGSAISEPRRCSGTGPPANRSDPGSAGRTSVPPASAWPCRAQGIRLAPNQSATKLAVLLDIADPDRSRDLCAGTVDTWVAWTLSRGGVHVSDRTNLAVTGLLDGNAAEWDESVLEVLAHPARGSSRCPVDSIGVVGEATALPGAPPIAGMAGDQQASLVGQGCVRPGLAKATFGTGGMLDLCVGPSPPELSRCGDRAGPSRSWPGA